jgi:hypothetical protein
LLPRSIRSKNSSVVGAGAFSRLQAECKKR